MNSTPGGQVLIDTVDALEAALALLAADDPMLASIRSETGPPRLRKRPAGFDGLAMAIVGQQVSTASAAAIWARLEAGLGGVTPEAALAAGPQALAGFGLSRPKIAALTAAAEAIAEGRLPLHSLADRPADEAHALLTAVRGVGPWTADIYLLFCLGHPDAFPAGDLAIREAMRLAFGLPGRPDTAQAEALAERWRPWRGAAATLLWAYYAHRRSRSGAPG